MGQSDSVGEIGRLERHVLAMQLERGVHPSLFLCRALGKQLVQALGFDRSQMAQVGLIAHG